MIERSTHRPPTGADIYHAIGGTPRATADDGPSGNEQDLRTALKGLRRILNAIELEETVDRSGRAELDMLAFARRMIAERYRRFQFFDGHLFSDPAWDIMLELFVAESEGREVPVTNLCITSNVPDTTVLRWIKTLCYEGLVTRHKDKVDKRRVLVQLTRPAADSLRRYLDEQMSAAERMRAGVDDDVAEGGGRLPL